MMTATKKGKNLLCAVLALALAVTVLAACNRTPNPQGSTAPSTTAAQTTTAPQDTTSQASQTQVTTTQRQQPQITTTEKGVVVTAQDGTEILKYTVDGYSVCQFNDGILEMYFGKLIKEDAAILLKQPLTKKEIGTLPQLQKITQTYDSRNRAVEKVFQLSKQFPSKTYETHDVLIFYTWYQNYATNFRLNRLQFQNGALLCETELDLSPHGAAMTGNVIAVAVEKGVLTSAPAVHHTFSPNANEPEVAD